MYLTAPESITVITDTLATRLDGTPHLLMSKMTVLPHLSMVIAYTGMAPLGVRWCAEAQTRVLSRDIDMLDVHTPGALRRIAHELESEQGGPPEGTTTVYHFGRSEERNTYVGYAYRSADDFRSEPLRYGFGVKPPPADMESLAGSPDVVELAVTIRREQDELPLLRRLHIGGDLVAAHLEGGAIHVVQLHRFADFDQQWQEMNDNLSRDNEPSDDVV